MRNYYKTVIKPSIAILCKYDLLAKTHTRKIALGSLIEHTLTNHKESRSIYKDLTWFGNSCLHFQKHPFTISNSNMMNEGEKGI